MGADGQVVEVDASKVRKGQRVGLRLEANPDVVHTGVVERIATLVQTESPMSRVKVTALEVKIEKTDPMMRPGMRFRGRIEVSRVPGVLQVPLAAITSTARGPEIVRVVGGKSQAVVVKLGRRSRDAVEVLAGLEPGDRVSLAGGAAPRSAKSGGPLTMGNSR
jgi:multidrug efflux pump subunit AcrA (membrane-fusion protein)